MLFQNCEKKVYIAFLSNKSEFIQKNISEFSLYLTILFLYLACDSEKNSPDRKI